VSAPRFLVSRNPDPDSSLPYLLSVPIDGGLALKAREPWPRASRVYCHPLEGAWPKDAELIEDVPVRHCRRRGAAIDLLLDRRANYRSQFVFTRHRGRELIFWQTAKAARAGRPGSRIPKRRAAGLEELAVAVDTRERYPYRFAGRSVQTTRIALGAGDYAVLDGDGRPLAAVERKTLENLAASLNDGSLALQLSELCELPAAAVVVEGSYSGLLRSEHAPPGWQADLIARVQARYPGVAVVFAESRKFAEEWTYRFLAAALAERGAAPDADRLA